MFDNSLPGLEDLKGADDSVVVAAVTGWARVEAAASARRLAAIAELVSRRVEGGSAECGRWSCDNWDAMAAEVAAAQGISHGMASGQMYPSVALRDRLPRVAELFADGMISYWLARTIAWHTDLIKDPEALRLVDKTLPGTLHLSDLVRVLQPCGIGEPSKRHQHPRPNLRQHQWGGGEPRRQDSRGRSRSCFAGQAAGAGLYRGQQVPRS
jgi:Domain of unknown function (DUF222)